jgi:exosortase family protein XrtF
MALPDLFSEFRPTFLFLGKFLGFYLVGNFLYGVYVTVWHPLPDPVTVWVTEQSAALLNRFGWETTTFNHMVKPTTYIAMGNQPVLAVYEGCNGLNVMIVFLSFLFSFGPVSKAMVWFIPMGVLFIYFSNLLRIILLFIVSVNLPDFLYLTHKYLFTAIIYAVVFVLWAWWVLRLSNRP